MSFFKSKDDHTDKWKDKYYDLLDSQEQEKQEYQSNQDLLCKTIIRFALAVKGLNPDLDPHLERIRELLKGGPNSEQLQSELELFSNALLALEESTRSKLPSATLLFDYLCSRYPEHEATLNQIQTRYEARQYVNSQRLFLALAEVLNPADTTSKPDFTADIAPIESNIISQQLIRFLDNAELPELFLEQGRALRDRIQDGRALGPIFQDTIDLLLVIKKHIEVEQQEMTEFLSSLTEQLAELGLKTAGVNLASEDAERKRHALDRDVAAQMADLQRKSATATQLDPLKQLISIRLQNISHQMQMHVRQEQMERENTQRELRNLLQKIREMEVETTELQSRLDVAQKRATRDPLTNLPNRLAFDERLSNEILRAERYGNTFSLAVWDIDFFKTINDTYGHKSGDKALVVIANLLSKNCRESDFVARFGGEEFVMLLPEAELQSALSVVNKIREIIEKSSFNAKGEKVSITLSCGLTEYIPADTNENIFVRADKALYQAKQNGRNQCVAA